MNWSVANTPQPVLDFVSEQLAHPTEIDFCAHLKGDGVGAGMAVMFMWLDRAIMCADCTQMAIMTADNPEEDTCDFCRAEGVGGVYVGFTRVSTPAGEVLVGFGTCGECRFQT